MPCGQGDSRETPAARGWCGAQNFEAPQNIDKAAAPQDSKLVPLYNLLHRTIPLGEDRSP